MQTVGPRAQFIAWSHSSLVCRPCLGCPELGRFGLGHTRCRPRTLCLGADPRRRCRAWPATCRASAAGSCGAEPQAPAAAAAAAAAAGRSSCRARRARSASRLLAQRRCTCRSRTNNRDPKIQIQKEENKITRHRLLESKPRSAK